ncbi:MAG: type VI secretion system baseplate subunit TssF [Gammaproteobacteria bacterium]|nr:type VI secretion system baseplate subunit TssF [Gammaproteobacteria bacterium]
MDTEIYQYYEDELRYLRELAWEFAQEYPSTASKLGLEQHDQAVDPYVERLLEGFAFLAARVRLKLDAEFPQFTGELLQIVYPDYLAQLPSAVIVELRPDSDDGALASRHRVPRGTPLRSHLAPGEQTACEYRLAHNVDLYPVQVATFAYLPNRAAIGAGAAQVPSDVKCALRLDLRATAGIQIKDIEFDTLDLFLRGSESVAGRLYECCLRDPKGLIVRDPMTGAVLGHVLASDAVQARGFDEAEAMMPSAPPSFDGYRILREYFMLPERYLFVTLARFAEYAAAASGDRLEIILLSGSTAPELENSIDENNVALFAAPAINLFDRRADRITVDSTAREYHLVVDRAKPMDFEVFSVLSVVGHYANGQPDRELHPLYRAPGGGFRSEHGETHYAVRRLPRVASSNRNSRRGRSRYRGTEVYLSLADAAAPPVPEDLRHLSSRVLCTNRDLPLSMVVGGERGDFLLESGAPVAKVKVLAGPTRPRDSRAHDRRAWQLLNHLSLNYQTLVDDGGDHNGLALRKLLSLYADDSEPAMQRLIDAIQHTSARPVVRRIRPQGPIVAARGVEVSVRCDERGFAGSTGTFLFGAVLERFIAKFASINSFTETVLCNAVGQEVMRWPARTGLRPLF